MTAREMIEKEEAAARINYAPGLGSDIGKPCIFSVTDSYLAAGERLIERLETENTALRSAHGEWEKTATEAKKLRIELELAQNDHDRCCVKMNNAVLRAEKAERERDSFQRCEIEASKEALELRDTLSRIATSFTAQHKDSGKCDDIGEIYHLLRESGVLKNVD